MGRYEFSRSVLDQLVIQVIVPRNCPIVQRKIVFQRSILQSSENEWILIQFTREALLILLNIAGILPNVCADRRRVVHFVLTRFARPGEASAYRMFPVCPCEYRPGCGHTVSPCGSAPTGILVTAPDVVSNM